MSNRESCRLFWKENMKMCRMGYVLHGIRRYLIIKRKSLIIQLENIIILNATHAHTSTESTSWSKIYIMKTCLTMSDDILSKTFFALRFIQQETLLSNFQFNIPLWKNQFWDILWIVQPLNPAIMNVPSLLQKKNIFLSLLRWL